MRLSLLIVCSLLFKVAAGQVSVNGPSTLFSANTIKNANDQWPKGKSAYRIIYMPVLSLLQPLQPIADNTPVQQLLEEQAANDAKALQTAFDAKQAELLANAQIEFDKQKDKAHTIVVIDNFANTTDRAGKLKYLSGRKFIFGSDVTPVVKTIIEDYTPSAKMDFTDNSLVKNDAYLKEYAKYLSSIVKTGGTGNVAEEVYPKAFPIVVMLIENKGYLHTDPAVGFTAQDLDNLKDNILKTYASIKTLELKPIDYSFKSNELKFNKLIVMHAYKKAKDTPYIAVTFDDAVNSWKLNDVALDLSKGKTQLSLTDIEFKDGENHLQLTANVGARYINNAIISLFDVKLNYNAGNYYLKVVINNQKPVEVKLGKTLGTQDGGGVLKVNDKVDLQLFQKTEKGEQAVEKAIWSTSDIDNSISDHFSFKVLNSDIKLLVQPAADENAKLIKVVYEKVVPPAEAYAFANINTKALPDAEMQSKATTMFATALSAIKGKNPALYSYFVDNNDKIQSYAYPSTDEKFKYPEEDKVLNGFADRGADYTQQYNFLDVINIKYKSKVISDATLVVRIHGNEKRMLLNASKDQSVEGKANAEPVLQKIALTNKDKAESIRQSIALSNLTDADIKDLNLAGDDVAILTKASAAKTEGKVAADPIIERIGKRDADMAKKMHQLVYDGLLKEEDFQNLYEIIPNDLSVLSLYSGVRTSRKLMYLNYDALIHTVNPDIKPQDKFTGITAHEMMHIYFGYQNSFSSLKWAVIRDKLGADMSVLGDSRCSAGAGHEHNNKEDEATCDEQKIYYNADLDKPKKAFP